MKFKNYFLICLVAMMAITACKKSGTPKPGTGSTGSTGTTGTTGTQIDTDVYLGGTVFSSSAFVAAYWKNNMLKKITDVSKNCKVTGIAVSGTTVYVCGYYFYTDMSNVQHNTAVYWIITPTTTSEHKFNLESSLYGVAVNNNVVYVVGVNGDQATIWENDSPVNLTPGVHNTYATAVTINANHVYVVGINGSHPIYWTDIDLTTTHSLDMTGVSVGSAKAITFKGSDMYVGGFTISSGVQAATYWINTGTPQRLTDNTSATSITVNSKGDIYVGGYNFNGGEHAAYWTNGTIKDFIYGKINAMTLVSDDVYMSGYEFDGYGYWKNDVLKPIVIQPADGVMNEVTSIAVVTHPHL